MKSFKTRMTRVVVRVVLAAALIGSTGCFGMYKNTDVFTPAPREGMSEVEMLQTFGAPRFSANVDTQSVYTYQVRDNKYIILFGLYEGYDLVVTCQGGVVKKISKVERPSAFCLFTPLPWAEYK